MTTLESKLRALVAEWPHDLRKLSGDHDGTEKRHCRRCQLEALLAERQPTCIGYPDCDGDLEGEPHSEKCPLAAAPSSGKGERK